MYIYNIYILTNVCKKVFKPPPLKKKINKNPRISDINTLIQLFFLCDL